MRAAHAVGATVFKVATHCTEADVGIQHLGLAVELGGHAVGGLMMTHLVEPAALADNARILADAGARVVYVADPAGALMLDGVRTRISAVRSALPEEIDIGIHAHNNLGLAVANTVVATVDRTTISLGYAGVYSSFLRHTREAAERFGIEPRDLPVELGRKRVVAGQEDAIIDTAASIAHRDMGSP